MPQLHTKIPRNGSNNIHGHSDAQPLAVDPQNVGDPKQHFIKPMLWLDDGRTNPKSDSHSVRTYVRTYVNARERTHVLTYIRLYLHTYTRTSWFRMNAPQLEKSKCSKQWSKQQKSASSRHLPQGRRTNPQKHDDHCLVVTRKRRAHIQNQKDQGNILVRTTKPIATTCLTG